MWRTSVKCASCTYSRVDFEELSRGYLLHLNPYLRQYLDVQGILLRCDNRCDKYAMLSSPKLAKTQTAYNTMHKMR